MSLADESGLDPQSAIGSDVLTIRAGTVDGYLYPVNLQIHAEEGNDLLQEVTAFIPNATVEQRVETPTFLGLKGCLEFHKFAVDPSENQFYFASV